MSELSEATKIQNHMNTLIEQAKTLLQEKAAALLSAWTAAEHALAEAQALARQWNRTQAQSFVLHEEFRLELKDYNLPLADLQHVLPHLTVAAHPTEPRPGVRVQLNQDFTFRDYPRGAEITLAAEEVADIEKNARARGDTAVLLRRV